MFHTTKGISEVEHNAQGWEANIHHKPYTHTHSCYAHQSTRVVLNHGADFMPRH